MDGEIGGSHVCLLSAQTLGENSQSQIGILNTFINFCKKLKEAKKKWRWCGRKILWMKYLWLAFLMD